MFRCLIESLVSFLAAFLLAACTDDSSGYEVVDARAKETASAMNSYDIEIKFETTVRYTSQNYRWFNILFIPDSVVLREIDAYGLSNPNGFNTTGFPDSLSFLLSEVPLNKPFVELSFYGRWTRLRGDSLYVVSDPVVHRIKRGLKNRSDTIKVSFNDFVEMGLVQKNLDEGLSVYASIFKANMMADSYMDSLGLKGFLLPLWSFSFEKENSQAQFDLIVQGFAEKSEWYKEKWFVSLVDSFVYYFHLQNNMFKLYQNVYHFLPLDSANELFLVDNELSDFNERSIERSKTEFALVKEDDDCMAFYQNALKIVSDSNLYVCKNGEWLAANWNGHADEYMKKIYGVCNDINLVVKEVGKYFRCDSSLVWKESSYIEFAMGICGIDVPYGNFAEVDSVVYYCAPKFKGTWEKASVEQVQMFRQKGNCSKENMGFQYCGVESNYSSYKGIYMCVENPEKDISYGWYRLSKDSQSPIKSEFVDEDSNRVSIYGKKITDEKNTWRYEFYTDSSFADSALYGILFPYSYYNVVQTQNQYWLKEPYSMLNLSYALGTVCPLDFYVATYNEWLLMKHENPNLIMIPSENVILFNTNYGYFFDMDSLRNSKVCLSTRSSETENGEEVVVPCLKSDMTGVYCVKNKEIED